jgi:hypothetical protein
METLSSSSSDLRDRLLPMMSDRRFHNLEIVCYEGKTLTSSTLLFAALLSSGIEKELAEIEKVF